MEQSQHLGGILVGLHVSERRAQLTVIITAMSLFTSDRERRLWLWTLAIVAAIYSTLGLAGALAGALRDRDLLDTSFILGGLLVIVTIVTQGLKTRPGSVEIVAALGVAVAYFMVFVRIGIPEEERTHLIEYGVVAILVHEALMERANQGRHIPVPALLALVVTALLGILDEGIQAILPNRVFDVRDVGFNTLAGLMALAANLALGRARRWRSLAARD